MDDLEALRKISFFGLDTEDPGMTALLESGGEQFAALRELLSPSPFSSTLPDYLPPQDMIPGLKMDYYEEWRRIHGDECPNEMRYRGRRSPGARLPTSFTFSLRARDNWCKLWAWAVPSPEALLAIQALKMPICEIGAGAGYWGMLLRQMGVECHLYDTDPPDQGRNHWAGHRPCWTPVMKGGVECARNHPDAALMLCWPPYAEPMAFQALQAYQGSTLIYIGEGNGGCTGDDAFHEMMDEKFEEPDRIHLPQFTGLHDDLYIMRRKP